MRNFFKRFIVLIFLILFPSQSFPQGSGFSPTQEQVDQVLSYTREWLALLDADEYEKAYDYLSDGLKSQISFEQWREDERDMKNQTGKLISRKIEELRWWPDVNGIPGALAVGAQTYGEFENGDHYKLEIPIMFGEQGELTIARTETSFASFEDIEKIRALQTSNSGKRFKTDKISGKEWQKYFDEIWVLSGWRGYRRDDQIVFDSAEAGAIWVFTTPQHFAHPAVVKRSVTEENGQVFINMIGYYAGNQADFDRWWRQFLELNKRVKDSLNSK